MSTMWTLASVRIAVISLTADELEAKLGRGAVRKASRGEPISKRPSATSHERSFCVYESPLDSALHPREHLAWVLRLLDQLRDILLSLSSELELDVRLGLSPSTGQVGFALDASDLGLLAVVGAQLNIDVYPGDREDG